MAISLVLLLSCSIATGIGALGSPDLPSYFSIITISLHMTSILIITHLSKPTTLTIQDGYRLDARQ